MSALPKLPPEQHARFLRLYEHATLLDHMAARLDDHADRRVIRLGPVTHPQQHARALKIIADLRQRATVARADLEEIWDAIDDMRQQRSAHP